jgi:iron complex transport system permease protein
LPVEFPAQLRYRFSHTHVEAGTLMANITLDLDALVKDGRLTAEEAARLQELALPSRAVGQLVQVFAILGALALAAGVVVLDPSATLGLLLALGALGFAAVIQARGKDDLAILGTGMAIAGTMGLAGWFGLKFGEDWPALAVNGIGTLIMLAAALYFRSRFLVAFVPLGLAAMIGSGTAYWHASYAIFISEALITVVLFGGLAVGLFAAAARLDPIKAGLATIAARVSWLVMNFGFWVGSLWGDHVGDHFAEVRGNPEKTWEEMEAWRQTALFIPDWVFIIGWAAVSITTVVALRRNRFAVNAAITFLAINAYTQFFERFGDSPFALLVGGASLLAFAWGLFHVDKRMHAAGAGI